MENLGPPRFEYRRPRRGAGRMHLSWLVFPVIIWFAGSTLGQAPLPSPTPATNPSPAEKRAAAEAAIAEAEQQLAKGTAEARRGALEKFRIAQGLFHELGDQAKEAGALNDVGAVHDMLGEKQKAREYYMLALPLRIAAGDRAGEAVTLNNIGALYRNLGQLQLALDHYQRSLTITRSLGERENEATTLNNMGAVYRALGEMQKALDVYAQALPLWKALGNKRGEAVTLSNLGGVYRSLGEPERALEFYQFSLERTAEAKDRRVEGETLNNLGAVHRALKDFAKASDYFEQALAIRRAVGDRRGEVATINNLAAVAFSLDQFPKALELYGQTLGLWRTLGDRAGEGLALHNLGESNFSNGDRAAARGNFQEALSIRREILDQTGEAATLAALARLDREEGRLQEAKLNIEQTLTIVESLRNKIASPDLRASYFATIQQYYELYIALLMQLHQQTPETGQQISAFLASERSRARSLIDLLDEAQADIRQGVDPALLAKEQELQGRFNVSAERYTRLLSGKHTPAEAEAASRELVALTDEYDLVQAAIRRASPRYAAIARTPHLEFRELQTKILDRETVLLEYKLGDDASFLWAVTQTAVAGYTLPKRADIETAARRVYELLTARNQRPVDETPAQRQTRLRRAEADYPAAAAELSKLVLGPLGPLTGIKRILIVSDGALQYIPFEALPAPGTAAKADPPPLVANYEIVHLPSVSVISELRRGTAKPTPAREVLAVLADPVFEKDDPRVRNRSEAARPRAAGGNSAEVAEPPPAIRTAFETSLLELSSPTLVPRLLFSRQEAESILRNVPASQRFAALNFKASRATATAADLSRYRYLHFATHGILNSQHPELSGVVLSLVDEAGRPQDGFLRLHDIYGLHLSADLVVLSACQTGLGREVRGEGLIGLTRGFMYAGAPRVVASLWKVDDAATAELMSSFYRGMLKEGKTPAAALRAAQIEMWRKPNWHRSPFYWAAFVLQGDWK